MKQMHLAFRFVFLLACPLLVPEAVSAIPDASGIIHGCYNTKNGEQRIIDADTAACRHGEAAIQWNQVGPQGLQGTQGMQGLQGIQGIQGQKGDTGPIGPSDLYLNRVPAFGAGTITVSDQAYTTIASLSIPAGDYLISGRLNVVGMKRVLDCAITRSDFPPSPPAVVDQFYLSDGNSSGFAGMGMGVGGLSASGPITVTMSCILRGGTTSPAYEVIENAALWAIRVGKLHVQ